MLCWIRIRSVAGSAVPGECIVAASPGGATVKRRSARARRCSSARSAVARFSHTCSNLQYWVLKDRGSSRR